MTVCTPAARAVMAVMRTDEGSGYYAESEIMTRRLGNNVLVLQEHSNQRCTLGRSKRVNAYGSRF